MAMYRDTLSQILKPEGLYLTDGGIETVLIYEKNLELPEFAAFTLLKSKSGRKVLNEYMIPYLKLAKEFNCDGFILGTPTWRASPDWANALGIEEEELAELNRLAVADLVKMRSSHDRKDFPIILAGMIGPRGDGYLVDHKMTNHEAREYHNVQIETLAQAGADCVIGVTINYVEEAIGIVKACQHNNIPCIISFTVETNGKLPSGQTLKEAIIHTDMKTKNGVLFYQINCAHPSHFRHLFEVPREPWMQRVRGLRCNPSPKSHEELNCSTRLESGDPIEFGLLHGQMKKLMPQLCVFGGCCGTNQEHLKQICITLNSLKD